MATSSSRQPPQEEWRSLDLFTGIGGMTHGLRGLARPVAYCEIDPFARQVLQARMGDGWLPRAPICPDVKELDAAWLSAAAATDGVGSGGGAVDLIMGGFPCQGFSPLGRQTGYDHAGSGLFAHILRLADALQPRMLFLENVPAILRLGMSHVVAELGGRGFEVRWCLLWASELGAPHPRRRWFCLAVRPGAMADVAAVAAGALAAPSPALFPWADGEPSPAGRMVPLREKHRRARIAALGNSVVPDCARMAFLYLATATVAPADAARMRTVNGWPVWGVVAALPSSPPGALVRPPALAGVREAARNRQVLRFDPTRYRSQRPINRRASRPLATHTVTAHMWATPRFRTVTAAQYLTERTLLDLPTQVRFEVRTPAAARAMQIAPRFVEWLMGYPQDWTLPSSSSDDGSGVPPPP